MKNNELNLELIFSRAAICHHFEIQVYKALQEKKIKVPTYLSTGTEIIAATLSVLCKDYAVFPQHRCHSYYLSFGGDPLLLAKELLGREDGCNNGKGGSASVASKELMIFGHSGLLGDQIPIGIGYAHASQKSSLVIAGDAAVEEDYALGAIGYAISKNCPVLMVVEDNDLSILTKKCVRRSWDIVKVARGFGLPACHSSDDPEEIQKALFGKLPRLVNIHCCRHCWHAGAGKDGEPLWNTYQIIKERLGSVGEKIDHNTDEAMKELWSKL